MLTCQEMLETEAKLDFDQVKTKSDQIADERFRLLFRALDEPEAFAQALRAFESMPPKSGPVH